MDRKGAVIHNVDLAWAMAATLGAIYPLYQLRSYRQRKSAHDLAGLILTFAAYPWAMAVFHLTPFDRGLVYAICLFSVPLYAVIMLRFIGYADEAVQKIRFTWFATAALLSLFALTNPWHGQFAQFEAPTPGEPNHLLDYEVPTLGVILALTFVALSITIVSIMTTLQMVRSRLVVSQFLVSVLMPLFGLVAIAYQSKLSVLPDLRVDGFFVATTSTLYILGYFMARNRVFEVLPITHTKVIGLMPDAIVILGNEGKVSDCNPAFGQLCSREVADTTGESITDLLPELKFLADGTLEAQQLSLIVEDSPKHYDVIVTPVTENAVKGDNMVLLRDVTEQATAYQQLQDSEQKLHSANNELARISTTDSLTGLRNRRYFSEQLELEMERFARGGLPFGILSIDVDRFKVINDTHGHQTGDLVLTQIARVMEAESRSTDTLARIGGEEFVVLLENSSPEIVATAADRFRMAVQTKVATNIGSEKLAVTVSIGAALVRKEDTMRELMHRVDERLYAAKRLGRNQCVLSDAESVSLEV